MSLTVSPTINTSKMSIGRRWAGQAKPVHSIKMKIVRPSLTDLSSPEHTDDFKDAARLVLIEAQEASRKRQQNEIGEKLQRIKNRIDEIIRDYDEVGEDEGEDAVDSTEDPERLFKSLTDPKVKSAYYNHLSHCMITCENKCEELEAILNYLQELFVQSQSGGTKKLLEQVEHDAEIDLNQATAVLGGALETAKMSVKELVVIKGRMDRLMANLIEYPDTNKGRKKLEKALLHAEDELKSCLKSIEELQTRIKFYSEKCAQLQTQLEVKTTECVKLQSSADNEVKQLRETKTVLEKEVKNLKNSLKEAQASPRAPPAVTTQPTADAGKLKKLEEELNLEKLKNQELEAEMSDLTEKHSKKLEIIKSEHESERKEMKGRFEEKLNSLMEADDDMFEVATRSKDSPGLAPAFDNTLKEKEERGNKEGNAEQEEMIQEEEMEQSLVVEGEEMIISSSSQNETLDDYKKEVAVKENQWKKKLEDTKTKCQAKVRILQKQLAEATSHKKEAEKVAEGLKLDLDSMNAELSNAKNHIDELKEKLAESEDVNASLSKKLAMTEAKRGKQSEDLTKFSSLFHEKEAAKSPVRQLSPVEVPSLQFPAMVPSLVHILPSPTDSVPMVSESILPQVATAAALDDLPDMMSFSMEQSVVSMDPAPLGSPLDGYTSPNGRDSIAPSSQQPVPYSLSMLAGSRLSHYSSAPQGAAISHSHPIIVEWVKAYDLVIKFKDGVISMLQEHNTIVPQLSSLIEELQAIEVHKLDKKADAQSQVMEMRFSLTLILHQMEQTLCESVYELVQMRHLTSPVATTKLLQSSHGSRVEELKEKICELHNELAVAESHYAKQIDAHKDVIARLTTKNESLSMEAAQMKNSILAQERIKAAMFSRVDAGRNTRLLREATDKKLLSEEEFQSIVQSMENYLTIPASRLVAVARRLLNKEEVNRLVLNLTKICSNTRQAAYVLESIVYMEDKREAKYRVSMSRYKEKRMELAWDISNALHTAEKKTGTPLTKPFYGPPVPYSNGCIVPVNRALPERPLPVAPLSSHRGTTINLASPTHTRSTKTMPTSPVLSYRRSVRTSESVRQTQQELIQQLQQQNLQQRKEELRVKHRATTADPSCMGRHRQGESRRGKHRAGTATSNFHSTNDGMLGPIRVLPSALSSKTSCAVDQTWDAKTTQQENYLNSKVPGYQFLPKIVEMDLPGNSIVALTQGKHSRGKKSTTFSHPDHPHSTMQEEGGASQGTRTWPSALPTIHVPTNTDTVMATH